MASSSALYLCKFQCVGVLFMLSLLATSRPTESTRRRWNAWHGSNPFQPSLCKILLELVQMHAEGVVAHISQHHTPTAVMGLVEYASSSAMMHCRYLCVSICHPLSLTSASVIPLSFWAVSVVTSNGKDSCNSILISEIIKG